MKDNHFLLVDCGVIRVKPVVFSSRLLQIFNCLGEIITYQKPDAIAIEEVFVARNPASALKLGHARGAAMLAGATHGLIAAEYTALQIKKAVVGYGKADKSQVQQMVTLLLGLQEQPVADAADALAVALCHGQTTQALRVITQHAHVDGLSFRRRRVRRRF